MLEETLAAFEHVSDICAQAGILPLHQDGERPTEKPIDRQGESASAASSWCFELDRSSYCSDTGRGLGERCSSHVPTELTAEEGGQDRYRAISDGASSTRSSCGEVDELAMPFEVREYQYVPRQDKRGQEGPDILLELDALRTQVARSDCTVVDVKQQLSSTCERLEQLESTMRETKKTVERTVQDQARHWRAICDELVQDKRSLATQLAEERGRFAALKRHLDTHNSELQHLDTRPATPTSDTSTEPGIALPCDHHSPSPRANSAQSSPRRRRRRDGSDDDRDQAESERRPFKDERLPSFRRNYLSSGRTSR